MGKEKAGFLTPKAIANRIKAKGLQKLRWYCQMCQKQCRDENGFKCHLTSESHQRQLLLFADNPDKFIDGFSKQFFDDFIELLKRRFGTRKVKANTVYQEYIHDRDHVHMNSTQWETLTEFAKWLGREGYVTAKETEQGFEISYIDRDPETIRKQNSIKNKEKMDLDDDERMAKFIEKQVERAAAASNDKQTEFTELKRESEEEKVVFNMGKKKEEASTSKSTINPFEKISSIEPESVKKKESAPKKKSALDEIIEYELQQKQKSAFSQGRKRKTYDVDSDSPEEKVTKSDKEYRKANWLCNDIVVKIVTKKLGDEFYKKKGVIKKVDDKFIAVVKLIESGKKCRVDQDDLETVIPSKGKLVMIVNGKYMGNVASLESIDTDKFCSSLQITSGPLKGKVIEKIQYEDFSKLNVS